MPVRLFAITVLALVVASSPVAQELPGWNQLPYSGVVQLTSGFNQDPHSVDVSAGGNEAINLPGMACEGFISENPDMVVEYSLASGSGYDLTVSAASDTDVSLVVRTPDGVYYCDDDSAGGTNGTNPMLTIAGAQTGRYRVWAGVFGSPGVIADATIALSEVGALAELPQVAAPPPPAAPTPAAANELVGWNQLPFSGVIQLTSGFNPDPQSLNVRAGGSESINLSGQSCAGYISESPDVVVEYSLASGSGYDLTVSAASDTDVSLVVRTPDGQYLCDDDSAGGTNPMLTIPSATTGRYRVWAGVFGSPGVIADATIGFSEVGALASTPRTAPSPPVTAPRPTPAPRPAPTPPVVQDPLAPSVAKALGSMSNAQDAPVYGYAILNADFAYDPRVIDVMAGGSEANPLSGAGCTGFVGIGPDAVIDYTAGSLPVTISAAASQDLSLVVLTPNGSYYCDDDSGENNNPRIDFASPESGQYRVWVGTYASGGQLARSHLGFSETGEAVVE